MRRTHTGVHVQRKSEPILESINKIINIACATRKIKTLQIKEKFKIVNLRPQINVFLESPPGELKTTILQEIGQVYGVTILSYATYPAMIGSIDRKTGTVIPGTVWQTRNNPLLLDEFKTGERGDAGAIDVLLGVLETGYYKRKIAIQSQPYEKKDDDLYYRIRDGEIEVQTRFPCIIATMKDLNKNRSQKVVALIQRCIRVRYDLPDKVVDAVLQGSPIYHHQEFNPPPEVTITRKDYEKIIGLAKEVRSNHKKFREVYARSVGDLCRIYAVRPRHDEKFYHLVCFLKAGYDISEAIELSEEY